VKEHGESSPDNLDKDIPAEFLAHIGDTESQSKLL
jgi:hypothetical protein